MWCVTGCGVVKEESVAGQATGWCLVEGLVLFSPVPWMVQVCRHSIKPVVLCLDEDVQVNLKWNICALQKSCFRFL